MYDRSSEEATRLLIIKNRLTWWHIDKSGTSSWVALWHQIPALRANCRYTSQMPPGSHTLGEERRRHREHPQSVWSSFSPSDLLYRDNTNHISSSSNSTGCATNWVRIQRKEKVVNLWGNQPRPNCSRSVWVAARAQSPVMGRLTPHRSQFSWRNQMPPALPVSWKGNTSSGRVKLGENKIRMWVKNHMFCRF